MKQRTCFLQFLRFKICLVIVCFRRNHALVGLVARQHPHVIDVEQNFSCFPDAAALICQIVAGKPFPGGNYIARLGVSHPEVVDQILNRQLCELPVIVAVLRADPGKQRFYLRLRHRRISYRCFVCFLCCASAAAAEHHAKQQYNDQQQANAPFVFHIGTSPVS